MRLCQLHPLCVNTSVAELLERAIRVVPGDPVRLMAGGMAPEALIEQIASEMGLRDPIYQQFGRYVAKLVQGDLGQSFVRPASGAAVGGASFDDSTRAERAEVWDLIAQTAPMTLQLALLAMVFALIFSVPIGVWGGLRPGKWPDRMALYISSVFVSLPNFWLGIVLALLLSVKLNLLPAIGYHGFAYTILPALVLSVEITPFIIRTLSGRRECSHHAHQPRRAELFQKPRASPAILRPAALRAPATLGDPG